MKSGVVLLLCVVSTNVLVCSTAETTSSPDDGTSPLSFSTLKPTSADHVVEAVQQDPSPLTENTSNTIDNNNGKIAGVFLNFTRDLVNFTNTAFGKNKQSSDETEQDEDVRIQDLLRGILADEFGSEEDEINDDSDSEELDVFHDESDELADDDESSSVSTVASAEVSSSSLTTDSTDNSNDIEAGSDDGKDDQQNDDDENDEKLATNTEEAGKEEIASERTSRADTVQTTESGEREGRSRERKSGRRGTLGKKTKSSNKKSGKTDAAKYNRYVDAVFKRMNTLIRNKRMDPLRVNLYAGNSNDNNKLASKLKKSGNRGSSISAKRGKHGSRRTTTGRFNPKNTRRGNRPHAEHKVKTTFRRPHHRERREEVSKMDNKMRPSSIESMFNKTVTTPAPSEESANASSESKEMKQTQEGRPTRGVLHGLSTLRRTGPVKVVRRGQNTRIVRTKFLLGPVALEILSKKSNSTKSNSPSATATARSLKGVLEIRLKNSGPTRIRRLRVFPPSNVRVEGESNGMKKQGYRKITPVAARRLMSVANQVVRQSDRHRTKPSKMKGVKKPAGRKGQKKNNRKFGK